MAASLEKLSITRTLTILHSGNISLHQLATLNLDVQYQLQYILLHYEKNLRFQ